MGKFNREKYLESITSIPVPKDMAWKLRARKNELTMEKKKNLTWEDFFSYLLEQEKK